MAEHNANGFIVDFGDLKWLKEWLNTEFDHALVLNDADPYLDYFRTVLVQNPNAWAKEGSHIFKGMGPFARLCVVPNCGAEGLAEYTFNHVSLFLGSTLKFENVMLAKVTVSEDSKNSATYYNPALGGCGHE
jgi:6-pyruvoyl-tetrahydropterin synthase